MATSKRKVSTTKPRKRPEERKPSQPVGRGTGLLKVLGLLMGVFAVFTLIDIVSYLFTWKADQSLTTDPGMMGLSVDVNNLGGKLGYKWGRFLVAECFGLGSFALVILFFAAAIRLFFRKHKWGFTKTIILTVSAAIISSVILSFCSSLVCDDNFFEGGLGGECGALVVSYGVNVLGEIVSGLILLVLVVIWLLYAGGAFSKWFVNLGEGERKPRRNRRKEEAALKDGDDSDKARAGEYGEDESSDSEDDSRGWRDDDDDGIYDGKVDADADWKSDGDAATGADDAEIDGEEDADGAMAVGAGRTAAAGGGGSVGVAGAGRAAVAAGAPGTGSANSACGAGENMELEVIEGEVVTTEIEKELPRINTRDELSKYTFPPLDLLDNYTSSQHTVAKNELERNNIRIRTTLQNYRIDVTSVTACPGPTVTLYKVTPAPGVKISAIRNLEEDIAMALGIKGVRVVTLPGSVGIEVPNDRPSIVPLKSLLNDKSFRETTYELPVAMGITITQQVKVFDLTDAPHLLVAGATKQGKSVGLNVIIASLLYAKHPSEMKLVFIDPKMVEFNAYSKLLKHHLAVLPTAASEEDEKAEAIIKHADKAEETLRSLCVEMDERYSLMSVAGVNNVKSYNEKYKDRHLNPQKGHRFLPYIVVIIDEYADLIMSDSDKKMSKSITNSIVRLAQKGRAAGLHVIIATQRPTVDVITGLIKTNFPMRIAFRTVSRVDSMTILDNPGADKLIGKGDMLFYAGVEMERMQCAMVGMEEIGRITDFIGSQTAYKQCYNTPYYLPEPKKSGGDDDQPLVDMQNMDGLFKEAAEFVVTNQKGSTSLLQRRFGVGFARAGKIMDQLEAAGVVGPQDGSKPRMVLVSDLDSLQSIFDAYLK